MSTAFPDAPPPHDLHALYRDHNGWLQGWLRRRLGDRERAADIAHDTFLRLLVGSVAQPLREPRSFLATVAKRVMVDHLRRRSLEEAYLEALAHQPELQECSPEERLLMLETLLQLDAMLDGLGHKARQAFLLAQLDGLGYAEIAERLGVSVSSVTKYMARATEQCLLFALDAQA
ncbi:MULTISPECIES: sigma-70 family RNA polymerase sigma factor [unclassified Pseudomonas]|uniref:sigma-70 family RNA polymerase sigma factor n=1 Tax=unclassified Pseudomonas TaxID=196821 RepID=UPI00244CE4CE|nr:MULTISPECIES: sigma-70 family RNA polymerase sigma factor [unclassified Pseudomonas]MDG9929139.1 sigma-70 family RNA polymerase sigma factor [Pseudomonas sp. GD04042]MDH0484079.1 sigma-70 family RNA polymerase sigma factor [Pseudomonas sp. GD04015]MDH0605887.1 sigma-70 family RNA polymerase sigma factor [Pseudomonas sp. GD03869]MDH0897423.1 sigma-70 family RNA polymerase sigma factor [Pseudomonas sp. GD03875]MDH1065129.1 sigma-70 family RNA polymerase sigma factor [Pseudomonas sp. GD03985]